MFKGRVKQMVDSGLKFDDANIYKVHLDEFSSFIDSIQAVTKSKTV